MKKQLFRLSVGFCLLSLGTAHADCANGSCGVQNSAEADSDDSDIYTDDDCDEDGICYYYFYDADLEDSWYNLEPSWPGKREDSWYDQLTR